MRLNKFGMLLALLVCAILCAPDIGSAAEEGKLLKIVALSRHGVRSPTQSAKLLESWSQKPWPAWPVAQGDLTPRGARLVTAMWQNMRPRLAELGLIPPESCPAPGSIYVRADTDERTRATARALLDGLAPDCRMGFAVSRDKIDPLFHPVKAGLYKFKPVEAAMDVLSMTDGGLEELQENFSGTLELVSRILGSPSSALCARFSLDSDCSMQDLPNAVSVSSQGNSIRLMGSLDIASSVAEIFLLEYGEWPGVAAGWGYVDATTLSQVLPIHAKIFDVVNRAPLVAWARGGSLLTEMAQALAGTHPDQRCNEANLVIFVGHDTNIANIGALLGIEWQASGYPRNSIPPGAVLFLELWEKDGVKYVLARFHTQTLKGLHSSFPPDASTSKADRVFAPVSAIVSAPPVVGQARFDLDQFLEIARESTKDAPMAPPQSPPLDFNRVQPAP